MNLAYLENLENDVEIIAQKQDMTVRSRLHSIVSGLRDKDTQCMSTDRADTKVFFPVEHMQVISVLR